MRHLGLLPLVATAGEAGGADVPAGGVARVLMIAFSRMN
jgi:hypothetical protein